MEEVNKEESDVETIKDVLMASSSSISDGSMDTMTLTKLTSCQGRITGPTRRSTKGGWTEMEDNILTKAVKMCNGKNWKKIAEFFPGRSDVQCLHRWQKVLNPDLIKGPWTKEEDDRIIELVEKYGCKKWSIIAKSLPGRIGKQCRERWHNHLNPAIKKDAWTQEEELALIRAHQIYGNKWAEIARFLPGRADNSIKNHWNCSVKKKLDSYSASRFCLELPKSTAHDFYDPVKQEMNGADMGRQNGSSASSPDRKLRSEDCAAVCLVSPVIGNASGDGHHLELEYLSRKVCRSSKQQVNDLEKSPNKMLTNDRSSTFNEPAIVRNRDDASTRNYYSHIPGTSPLEPSGSMHMQSVMAVHGSEGTAYASLGPLSGNSPLESDSPSPILRTRFPLELTTCTRKDNNSSAVVPSLSTERFLVSPKNPQLPAITRKGLDRMNMRLSSQANDSSCLPAPTCELGGVSQVGNCETASLKSPHENSTLGDLCYEPPNLKNLGIPFATGKYSNIGSYFQQSQSPVSYSSPSNHDSYISVSENTPESILRSAAKSFKHTPSIIRKRGRGTLRVLPEESSHTINDTASDHDSAFTPDLNNESSDNSCGSKCSRLAGSICPQEDPNCMDILNVKRLIFSPSDSSKYKNGTNLKSIEKRLEYAFDLELNDANAKCTSSATAASLSDSDFDASKTFMTLDSTHKLRAGSECLTQNFMLLGTSIDCSL